MSEPVIHSEDNVLLGLAALILGLIVMVLGIAFTIASDALGFSIAGVGLIAFCIGAYLMGRYF